MSHHVLNNNCCICRVVAGGDDFICICCLCLKRGWHFTQTCEFIICKASHETLLTYLHIKNHLFSLFVTHIIIIGLKGSWYVRSYPERLSVLFILVLSFLLPLKKNRSQPSQKQQSDNDKLILFDTKQIIHISLGCSGVSAFSQAPC